MRKSSIIILLIVAAGVAAYFFWGRPGHATAIGAPVDSLHGVVVYYNGSVDHVDGRNVSADGYNLGLKYQCVEFVKRYYYQHLHHRMPDSYGHAKDFFDRDVNDGEENKRRGLTQFSNPSAAIPLVGDLIIFSASEYNPYGHVAIVSNVFENEIEIIQQNPGAFNSSRTRFQLRRENGKWKVVQDRALGWLRKVN
jgi:surface antigen